MSYKPPYQITTKIIDLISKISINIGKLEVSNIAINLPMLRKINQIKTIPGTLQIEGNRLDEAINKVGNLSENQQKIIEQIKLDNKISATKLSQIVGISKRKIEENLAKLKEMQMIDRVGGTRGYWEVVENNMESER